MYNSSHWLVEAHAGLPLILDEPVGSTNVAGTQVTFTVQAAGSEPLQYQWFHNGSPLSDGEGISGSTGPSLILGSTREVNEGDYQVTITNSFGAVTSVTVHHEVIDPAITLQPVSQNKEPGETATLSVTAAGTALTYQWLKDGAPLDGATASALTLTNLQGSDAGIYSVTITAPHASTNSAGALLTVNLTSTDIEFSQSALPVSAMVVQRDGKILVGDFRTERLNSDGTVDDQFAGFIDSYAYAFALRSDGEILAAGAFRHLNNLPQPDLGLLQADGTSDSSFRPTLDGTVRALLIQTNHQILVGGDFQKVSGQPRKGIARLNSDGSLDSQFQSLGGSGLNDK